jgi:hypothetical protein
MNGLIDEAALHRVVVHVFQFLPHHVLVLDQLWMAPFLPELMGLTEPAAGLKKPQVA